MGQTKMNSIRPVCKAAIPLAEAGKLVTFGIVAVVSNIGYDYIKMGASQGPEFAVDTFFEKISIEVAKEYLEKKVQLVTNYGWE